MVKVKQGKGFAVVSGTGPQHIVTVMDGAMTVSERLLTAASAVLAGDESVLAAQKLEAVLLDEYLDNGWASVLIEGLALYAPGSDAPSPMG